MGGVEVFEEPWSFWKVRGLISKIAISKNRGTLIEKFCCNHQKLHHDICKNNQFWSSKKCPSILKSNTIKRDRILTFYHSTSTHNLKINNLTFSSTFQNPFTNTYLGLDTITFLLKIKNYWFQISKGPTPLPHNNHEKHLIS